MIGLRALVLNPNFLPISIFNMRKKPSTIPVEDAMTRIFAGTCEAVFHYDREILTQNENVDMKWPSVIVRKSSDIVMGSIKKNREFLYYRDHGRCQYCEELITLSAMTIDHVIPQCMGGGSEWTNIVTACGPCNSEKDAQLWKPVRKPYEPNYWQVLKNRRKFPVTIGCNSWRDFIGDWDAEVHLA